MSFEISAVYKLCNNKLLECGHRTRIKAEFFFKALRESFRKHHIANSQRRRYCFRKGVEIDYVALPRQCKKRFGRLCGDGKFRLEIVLYNIGGADIFLDCFMLLIQDYACTPPDSYSPAIV